MKTESVKSDRSILEKDGFIFYRSLKAAKNSTYTFRKNGRECAIGFDSIEASADFLTLSF